MKSNQLNSISLTLKILGRLRGVFSAIAFAFCAQFDIHSALPIDPSPLKIIVDYALFSKTAFAASVHGIFFVRLGHARSPYRSRLAFWNFSFSCSKGAVDFGIWVYQLYLSGENCRRRPQPIVPARADLSFQAHDQKGIMDLFYRLQNDVGSMHTIAITGLIPLITTVLTFLIMFVVAFRMDAGLALLALGVLPATGALSVFHLPRVRVAWSNVKKSDQESMGIIQEVLGAIRVVRAFAQEDREVKRFQGKAGQKVQRLISAGTHEAVYGIFVSLFVAIARAAALYLGSKHVQDGKLTFGKFFDYHHLSGIQLFRPLDFISRQVPDHGEGVDKCRTLFQRLGENLDIGDNRGCNPDQRAAGKMEFRDVDFTYPNGTRVLRNVSFSVEPGQMVGIVGPTGGGKNDPGRFCSCDSWIRKMAP